LASAMRAYVNRFAVAPGRAVAVFTNNDDGWDSAADLARAGVVVTAVIDSRGNGRAPPDVLRTARVIPGGQVIATAGGRRLRAIKVRSPSGVQTIDVDALGVSGGWDPNVHLACHHGARPVWD